MNKLFLQNIKHSLAIYADPPDAGFKQFTPLSKRQIIDLQSADPLLIAVTNLGTASSNQAALAEALLHALERYQGAEATGDGTWALVHARAVQQYAALLATQGAQVNAALDALSSALTNDPRDLDVAASDLESVRTQIASSGFLAEERQVLASLGLTVERIDQLEFDVANQNFAFTKNGLIDVITIAQARNTEYLAALGQLAAAMDGNIAALESNPLVIDRAPKAHAGGPYLVAEGENIVFDGRASFSPSNIIRYEWDLDGDGAFNDATGPNPGFTYTRAFQGLVGLKVTNADNLEDVSYALLEVTNVNNPPRITAFAPADRSLDLTPGSSQSFSVTASDPEGDAVSVQWLVDGTPTATGLTFTYTPSLASGGLHIIEAVATDASPLGGSERLSWIVALPAPADSTNLSMAMNGTSESGQGSMKLTYQITVTNNGPAPATGVVLTDTLPAGLSFGAMTASQGSCTSLAPRTVTCALGNLASGASATATLVGTPTTTATITNTARVTAAEFDPDLGNNSTSQGIEVDFLWFRPSEIAEYSIFAHVAVDASGVYLSTIDENDGSAFLIKYDTSGTEVWRHELFAYQQVGHGVAADTSGVYTIGFTGVGSSRVPSISKFDADGTELWTRQFGRGSVFPADIAVAASGVYAVVTYSYYDNPVIVKYDTNGTELWRRPLPRGLSALGQSKSIAADASGVYVVYLDNINAYVLLSKYDVDGNEIWTTSVTENNFGALTPSTLAVDAGGVYVVFGTLSGFVRKYTKDGAELWTRQVELFEASGHQAVGSDGSTVYVGGIYPFRSSSFSFPGLIRKYDVDGNEISAHLFGDATSALTEVQDFAVGCAGVFAAGRTLHFSAQSNTFVMKLSSPAVPCNPQAPTVAATSSLVVVNEGQVGRNSGIYANAGTHQPVSLSASVGTVIKTGTQDGSWEWSLNATDGPAQSQAVTITADDGQGEIATALFGLIVNNVAPIVTITGAPATSPAGAPISLNSTVTDRGAADSEAGFTYVWTVTHDGQSFASGSGASFRLTPTVGGTYQVDLRVIDKDGGIGNDTVAIVVVQTNRPPVASAGPDQSVDEGTAMFLNGSGSNDPDGDSLTYTWEQIVGTPVVLNLGDPVHPTFTAPNVPPGGETLTFQLTVFDGKLTSAPDMVDITVKDVNHPPVADAGSDQTVQEGSLVVLDGSQSYDVDNDRLTYSWVQTAGPVVSLVDASTAQPSFSAPLVGAAGETLIFALTVSDGLASTTDTVTVVAANSNQLPTANAGANQTKDEGSVVTLDGTLSSDPDMDPLAYRWTQSAGPAVTLSDPTSATPTFTAPLVGPGGVTLEFQLIVNDGWGSSAPDTVTVTVLDINDPPACDLAQATPALLWPPNHKLVPVAIVGVADPNNDQVTLTITGVMQDEPVNGVGDGDTSPDAVPQGETVLLRAERAGTGNGRVYEVTFTAVDSQGGHCTGSVTVCVPHDRQGAACVDDGQQYDSTLP